LTQTAHILTTPLKTKKTKKKGKNELEKRKALRQQIQKIENDPLGWT
jgi:hypothetical protein